MRPLPLTLDQVRHYAPSVFAEAAHESRSHRYVYVPTVEPLKALMREGFEPFSASQSRSRIPGKSDFTKHMLRLRHRSTLENVPAVGDYAHEVIIVNSHDGTSAAHIRAGIYRFVCLNGMVVPETEALNLKVYHKGDAQEVNHDFITAAYEVTGIFDRVTTGIEEMKAVNLPTDVQVELARASLAIKYDEPKVTPMQVLERRFDEDDGSTAWQVLNTLQHNLVERGGIRPPRSAGRRARTTRPITGIDQNIKVNEALWSLAQTVARHLA